MYPPHAWLLLRGNRIQEDSCYLVMVAAGAPLLGIDCMAKALWWRSFKTSFHFFFFQ